MLIKMFLAIVRTSCVRKMRGVVSERPEDTPSAATVVSKNVVGAMPHGRICGASRPVEGKKRPFPLLLSMIGGWESPCSIRDGFGLRDSSACSSRRGMACNIEMENAPAVMADDEEAVQKAKSHGGYSKEVHRCGRLAVIPQEGQPTLRRFWISGCSLHPARDGSLRHVEAQHEKFAMNPGRAPGRILRHHLEESETGHPSRAFSSRLDFSSWRSGSSTCENRRDANGPRSPA